MNYGRLQKQITKDAGQAKDPKARDILIESFQRLNDDSLLLHHLILYLSVRLEVRPLESQVIEHYRMGHVCA
jgi:hypothetical protein